MNGIHNLDVSILINPYLRELMRYVAESANVEYIDSYREEEKKDKVPYRFVRQFIQDSLSEESQESPMMEEEVPMQKGLMAKQSLPTMEVEEDVAKEEGVQ